MRSRSVHRHDEQRVKIRVRINHGDHAAGDAARTGKVAHASQRCSCLMCGNPRRHWGFRTLQERRGDDAFGL